MLIGVGHMDDNLNHTGSPKKKRKAITKEQILAKVESVRAGASNSHILEGEPGDARRGVVHRREYVDLLERNGISWCIYGNTALRYHGVPMGDSSIHDICTRVDQLETVRNIFLQTGLYSVVGPLKNPQDAMYAPFPMLKRNGVHLYIRILPSTLVNIDLDNDCETFTDESTNLLLRAPLPAALIRSVLHLLSTHNYSNGIVMAELLLLHNADNPRWGDNLVDELKDERVKANFLKLCRVRAHNRSLPEGINRGKWDDVTDVDRRNWRIFC